MYDPYNWLGTTASNTSNTNYTISTTWEENIDGSHGRWRSYIGGGGSYGCIVSDPWGTFVPQYEPREYKCSWCGQVNLVEKHLCCDKCGGPRDVMQ